MRLRGCHVGFADVPLPSAVRVGVLANAEGDLALHNSLDAPRCWREICRGYKYPVELAARRGSDETFA
jgi:hypothetical protein